jgi:CDP-glycerol glycerophosphotransferase (TagB/SpsB family)
MIASLKMRKLKIAIKFKNSAVERYYVTEKNKHIFDGIDIFTGSPSEVMPFAKTIITGLSTAIFEALAINKKVILYEPVENGYCKMLVNKELLAELPLYTSIDQFIDKL